MPRRKIDMYEYRQVILHMRLGESDRAIARTGLVSRTTCRAIRAHAGAQGWLDPKQAIPTDADLATYFRSAQTKSLHQSSLAQPYVNDIETWVRAGIQATTIHATLQRKYDFQGSYNSVQRLVKKIKANAPKEMSTVLTFHPGESAQIDFGKGPTITDVMTGETFSTWFFVMVLSWSRHQYAEIVRHQKVATWLNCHRRAFEFFNGVPHRLIIDNAKCAITKACYYDPEVQRAYADCAQGYGFIISPCPPREPKKKGRVESGVKYIKNRFMPLREFRSLADANEQLQTWILETAGNRDHGTTHQKPLTAFEETERYLLKPLPTVPPELATWKKVRVHGDCHVQFERCRYSVPYQNVHELLWLRASATSIHIYKDYERIAIHPRLFKKGACHTIDAHLPPNAFAFKMRDPTWCLKEAKRIGPDCEQLIRLLFGDRVLDQLRAVQGILQLEKKYGRKRLNAACRRAICFGTNNYRSVKQILKQGIEYAAMDDETAFNRLAKSYTGAGEFCRDTKQLLQ